MEGRREDEVTDAALVRAARGGDDRAFEALLLRHEARVVRLLRLLGVARDAREDVAQEVFIRVFRHLGGFRTSRPFTAWIYRITVNAAHDHRNQVRRLGRREQAWDPVHEDAPARARGADEVLDLERRRRRLEAALEGLSERERAVFVLCQLEELTTRDVARALGISAITVRRHLGRARSRLQEILAAGSEKASCG